MCYHARCHFSLACIYLHKDEIIITTMGAWAGLIIVLSNLCTANKKEQKQVSMKRFLKRHLANVYRDGSMNALGGN